MVRMKETLWGTGKVVVTESGFCVLEGLISMVEKGVLGSALIKKRHYWPNGVPAEDFLCHIQKKCGWGCGCDSRFNEREELEQ